MTDDNEALDSEAAMPNGGGPSPFATECDLVMKGGITSGIVYPLAIKQLAGAFRLRSIGGTSAGAIAASAAAAAELGRQRKKAGQIKKDPEGFAELAKLPDYFGSDAADRPGTKLSALFKPQPALRSSFAVLMAGISASTPAARAWAVFVALLRHHWPAAAVALLLGTLPLWFTAPGWAVSLWLLGFSMLLVLGALLWRAARLACRELPKHGFGLCSGMPGEGEKNPEEALTVWLADYIDNLAGQVQAFPGQHKPLTFADLRQHGIDLKMMTTCLTLGRPFRLPFEDVAQVRENKPFMFRRSEFARLFPANVVDWMVATARPPAPGKPHPVAGAINFEDYFNLPEPANLPVIVAARMSLSFPLLLSAVPLHAVDYHQKVGDKQIAPERCWFTDGGVGSNFPIHFFDQPLPTRPTFGLDLGLADSADDQRVVFASKNSDARLSYWRRFAENGGAGSIAGFLGAVLNVAKDWNHETLSHLPGFRDRIGLIRLTAEEGGLNLAMPKARILQLGAYGETAGREFVARFGAPGQASRMNWENHQLIRLRLLLASLAEQLQHLERGLAETSGSSSDYARFFTQLVGPESYRFSGRGKFMPDPHSGLYGSQAGLAKWTLDQLRAVAERLRECQATTPGTALDYNAPKPTPELKLRPRI